MIIGAEDQLCGECRGDGKCPDCYGSGTNTHLNQSEPSCQRCSGIGKCPSCLGTGQRSLISSGIQELGLNRL